MAILNFHMSDQQGIDIVATKHMQWILGQGMRHTLWNLKTYLLIVLVKDQLEGTHLEWTLAIEWCETRYGFKYKYQKDVFFKKIGLSIQDLVDDSMFSCQY